MEKARPYKAGDTLERSEAGYKRFELCPVCGEYFEIRDKSLQIHSHCKNGHEWYIDLQTDKIVVV